MLGLIIRPEQLQMGPQAPDILPRDSVGPYSCLSSHLWPARPGLFEELEHFLLRNESRWPSLLPSSCPLFLPLRQSRAERSGAEEFSASSSYPQPAKKTESAACAASSSLVTATTRLLSASPSP